MVAAGRFLFGAMRGEWSGLAQAPPEAFYLWARAVTAALGTADSLVIYHAGLRWAAASPPRRRSCRGHAAARARVAFRADGVPDDVPRDAHAAAVVAGARARDADGLRFAGAAAGLAAAHQKQRRASRVLPLLGVRIDAGRAADGSPPLPSSSLDAWQRFSWPPHTRCLDLPTFLNQFARCPANTAPTCRPEPSGIIYMKHLRNAFGSRAALIVVAGLGLGAWKPWPRSDRSVGGRPSLFPLLLFPFHLEPVTSSTGGICCRCCRSCR